jgi:hypothetical protein
MALRTCLFTIGLLLSVVGACTNTVQPTEPSPDPDAITLVTMSEQARQIAQPELPDVALRQLDSNADLSEFTFRFTDSTATKEIDITSAAPNAPPEQWSTQVITLSPLLGWSQPDMNLQGLRVGPNRVARAISTHWSGCKVRFVHLSLEEGDLVWMAWCDTPQGTVSGTMSNRTGAFQPSNAPPGRMPITATPAP